MAPSCSVSRLLLLAAVASVGATLASARNACYSSAANTCGSCITRDAGSDKWCPGCFPAQQSSSKCIWCAPSPWSTDGFCASADPSEGEVPCPFNYHVRSLSLDSPTKKASQVKSDEQCQPKMPAVRVTAIKNDQDAALIRTGERRTRRFKRRFAAASARLYCCCCCCCRCCSTSDGCYTSGACFY